MNILFVNYGDFTTNSLNHIGAFANALSSAGHACVVAVPFEKQTLSVVSDPLFIPALYEEVLNKPILFPDGRGADLIHAWTPREHVRKFVLHYQSVAPTPARLLVHLEDNEQALLEAYTHRSVSELCQTESHSGRKPIPDSLCHPLRMANLLRLADGATVIIDKLRELLPINQNSHLLFPGVDVSSYQLQASAAELRQELGIAPDERVLTFTGSTSFINEPEMRELYLAVALLNRDGIPTKLIRTGFTSPQFRSSLPDSVHRHVVDLGLVEKSRLPGLLSIADVLVQPGRPGAFNDYRLPSKVPEFLASGRPVVLPHTNIALLMRDGIEGLFLKTGTPEDIAAACRRVFEDPGLASRLGENGDAFARKHFDLKLNATRLLEIYEQTLAQPSRTPWSTLAAGSSSDISLLLEEWTRAGGEDTDLLRNILQQARLLERAVVTLENKAHKLPKVEEAAELQKQHAANLESLVEKLRTHLDHSQEHSKNLELTLEKSREIISDLKLHHELAVRDAAEVRRQLDTAIEASDRRSADLRQQMSQRDQEIDALRHQLQLRHEKIRRLESSFSWRVTSPLRDLRRLTLDRWQKRSPHVSAPAANTANLTHSENGTGHDRPRFVVDQPNRWDRLKTTRIAIRGWLLLDGTPERPAIRATVGDREFPGLIGLPRVDVKASNPDHPHALDSGFAVDIDIPRPGGTLSLQYKRGAGTWVPFLKTEVTLAPDASDEPADPYHRWIRLNEDRSEATKARVRDEVARWSDPPVISLLIPVFNTPEKWLRRAIESVLEQSYPHWELCIADDASSAMHVRPLLEQFSREDRRIKVVHRQKNGHISAASNSALELATGSWIGLLDHDDELAPHALHEVASAIRENPDADLVYSDEDKIDEAGIRSTPYFKPDFLPDLFTAQNFISHFAVYRASLVREIGGFRVGCEGSQDWDLALRLIEQSSPDRVRHVPKILYHWRMVSGSTALLLSEKSYPVEAARKALTEHLARTQQKAEVEPVAGGHWRIRFGLPDPAPLVSLIMPTRNNLSLAQRCVESILEKTTYPTFELVVIDNGSDAPDKLAWLNRLSQEHPETNAHSIRVIRDDRPFNYSALNNAAVAQARGEFVCLINNDLEVITPDWLNEMIAQAARPGVGCVGAMLYYPDDTIQHAGVVLGVGGVAGHAFKRFPRGTEGVFNRARLVQNYSAVTAACLAVRKLIYEQVGGLGEKKLAVAFNDVDFCLKVRAAGYRNVWTPFAELYHHESASRGLEDTPEKHARFRREIETMQERWGPLLLADPAYNPNLTLQGEDFAIAPEVSRASLVPATLAEA